MKLRTVLSFAAALAFAGAWAAQPAETVELANGTVLMGHTSRQNIEKGTTLFRSDSALMVVPREKVSSIHREVKNLDKLSEAWQNWFAVHPEYVSNDGAGKKTVTLHRITRKRDIDATDDVLLLERSPKYVKYYTMSANTDTIVDDQVKLYSYARRDDLDLTGIVMEIITTDGSTYRGQLVQENRDGVGVLTDENIVEVVPNDKVASKRFSGFDTEAPIEEQIEFLDLVSIDAEKGEATSHTGIITLKNYVPGGKKAAYLTVFDPNSGSSHNVDMAKVKTIAKNRNTFYKPRRDVRVEADTTMLVNGIAVKPVKYSASENKDEFMLATTAATVVKDEDNVLRLQMRDCRNNQNVTLIPVKERQQKKDVKRYYFSFKELYNNAIPCDRTVSRNGIATLTFDAAPGTYLVYRQADRKAFLIRVEK